MNQDNNLAPLEKRRLLDRDITSLDLVRFKNYGVKPYYVNSDDIDYGLVEFTKPLGRNSFDWGYKPKPVYLLTPEEFDKANRLAENTRQIIELSKQKIDTLKQLTGAVLYELTK